MAPIELEWWVREWEAQMKARSSKSRSSAEREGMMSEIEAAIAKAGGSNFVRVPGQGER